MIVFDFDFIDGVLDLVCTSGRLVLFLQPDEVSSFTCIDASLYFILSSNQLPNANSTPKINSRTLICFICSELTREPHLDIKLLVGQLPKYLGVCIQNGCNSSMVNVLFLWSLLIEGESQHFAHILFYFESLVMLDRDTKIKTVSLQTWLYIFPGHKMMMRCVMRITLCCQ